MDTVLISPNAGWEYIWLRAERITSREREENKNTSGDDSGDSLREI